MFNKVKLLTVAGDLVGSFTVLHFPLLTNHKGIVGYPSLLFHGERAYLFDQLVDATKGDAGQAEHGVYIETMAAAIVPIPGVDNNGYTEVQAATDSSDEADAANL